MNRKSCSFRIVLYQNKEDLYMMQNRLFLAWLLLSKKRTKKEQLFLNTFNVMKHITFILFKSLLNLNINKNKGF